MTLIPWILNNWKPLLISALLIATHVYALNYGMEIKQAEWDVARTKALENNLKINAEVSNDYQKKLADIRKRYDALRLRTAGSVPNANTPLGHNAAPAGTGFPWKVAEPIGDLMLLADTQTQQLLACQNWIREQSK